MKVYTVSSGCLYEGRVDNVFLSEEKAMAFVEAKLEEERLAQIKHEKYENENGVFIRKVEYKKQEAKHYLHFWEKGINIIGIEEWDAE